MSGGFLLGDLGKMMGFLEFWGLQVGSLGGLVRLSDSFMGILSGE